MSDLTPHPLDDDAEYKFTDETETSRTPVYRPLLKWSFVTAAASFAVLFLSSVASNNAPPNSSVEFISIAISRASSTVLLIACCGIMLAYRIPYLQNLSRDRKFEPGQYKWLWNGFSTLLYFNLGGLVMIWVSLLLLEPLMGAWIIVALLLVSVVFAGLMVTVAVWHNDFRRAYAVGVLTVILMLSNSGWMGLFMSMPRGRGLVSSYWPLGVAYSIMAATGLICAGYVQLLALGGESKQERNDKHSDENKFD